MSARTNTTEEHPLTGRLRAYGCSQFIPLDEKLSRPEQLNYLDLLPKQSNHTPILTAVAEHQGTALLYLVDACGDVRSDAASLAEVRKQLANRSDPAWLGVLRPGSLEIFPIGFHETDDAQPVKVIEERSATAPLFFQSLVHGTFEENHRLRGTDYVFKEIFGLLTQMTDALVPTEGEDRQERALEILSMAGRALFFRFLIDRDIVRESELRVDERICPTADNLKDVFSNAHKAAQTSAWLDKTYNGDFLPLISENIPHENREAREAAYLRFYKTAQGRHGMGQRLFSFLEAILRGLKSVGMDFQGELDWGDLDFAHIPVGVLSQVYESFSHRAAPRTARDTSVHYTPRTIASLMVDEAFAPLKNKAAAKVLDPSCGAGIFLVLAFRCLVRERWLRDEDRPKTSVIQEILYNQVRGFDISESALRLAALGLYITAIELNASPRPPQALKFPSNLRDKVLYRFGNDESHGGKAAVSPLGSLGPEVSADFNGTFDVAIGNPPWTPVQDAAVNKQFTQIGRRVLEARGFGNQAKHYQNPNNNPDLPFLWRTMEWVKCGGVIALAMHARLLARTSGKGFEAWKSLLQSVEVTGLINGANLRKTSVWDGMDAPFCVLFARNAKPSPDHRFHYAAPSYEPGLNGRGRFRIDYETAQPINAARVEKEPWLLKTLSLGTWLDVEIMEGLLKPGMKPLMDRWHEWGAKSTQMGEGYNRAPGLGQKFVQFLTNLHVFRVPEQGYEIEYETLRTYGETYGTNENSEVSANRPRQKELFQPPLVIVPKAPGDDQFGVQAYLSGRPLAFSKAYYGYSCAGIDEGSLIAALIFLVMHSTAFRYFSLMHSPSLGVDRMILTQGDIDCFPFPDSRTLPAAKKGTIRDLAHRLQHDAQKPWQEINEFIFSLYGLDADAVQVARDTLFAAASYRRAGRDALERTTHDTRINFITTLRDELEPYFDVCGEHVAVLEAEFQPDTCRESWFFLAVSRKADTVRVNPSLMREAMRVANERGSSRIIVHVPGRHGLLLGILNQRRWWTITRARLCAQHIIRERLNAFGLPEHA
jgi:hypothetical protein